MLSPYPRWSNWNVSAVTASSLEPFPIRLNRIGALVFCFYAFSSCEPVSTSLENAPVRILASLRTDRDDAALLLNEATDALRELNRALRSCAEDYPKMLS